MLILKKILTVKLGLTAKVYQDLGFGATAEYYERLK